MTAADLLRARYALAVMGQDQIGIFPLILPAARLVANRFRRGGGRPPQADYPPPRRPLPPPPDRLIPVVQKLINQNQKDEDQDLEGDTTMAGETVMGADGYEYGVDEYGRMVRRIPRRHPPRFQPADDSDLGFGADDGLGADDDDLETGDSDEADLDDLCGDLGADEETGEDLGFGFDTIRAKGKLEELKSKAARYQDRITKLQNKRFVINKERRISKLMNKLGKVKSSIAQIEAKIASEKKKQAAQRRQAAGLVAASVGVGMAARGVSGNQPGGVPATRGGQQSNRVLSASEGGQIRRAQAQNGMRFDVVAPPGSGRLVAVPMLASGSTINRNSTTIAVANTQQTVGVLTSEDIPYSVYRIVGFTAQISLSTADPAVLAPQINSGGAFVSNLQVKGGSNLFMHDSWQDAREYQTDYDHLRGLRDYPKVQSPNKASVQVAAIAIAADIVVISSFNLVVDQITDDVYGSGVPGPYAG